MDMNKEESVQYVTMKELSYADIEPAVYETPYTAGGTSRPRLTACLTACLSVTRPVVSLSDQQESRLVLSDSPLLTLQDLLSFSFQVSQAMDFLSSRNVRSPINKSPSPVVPRVDVLCGVSRSVSTETWLRGTSWSVRGNW